MGLNTFYPGIFLDGPDRTDVVDSRITYLSQLQELEITHMPVPEINDDPVLLPPPGQKRLVLIDNK